MSPNSFSRFRIFRVFVPMISLTLSCDHRVVDGAHAAEFMRDLANAISAPQLR